MQCRIIILLITGLLITGFCHSATFPLREKFAEVDIIEADDLYREFERFIIIDVRSKYEYDTIHMSRSRNIPLSNKSFVKSINRMRIKNPDTAIVFYCNGITCAKSYKAVKKAQDNDISGVSSMDWGILNWAVKYPDKTTFMGETPANPEDIIAKSKLKAHTLSPSEFVKRIKGDAVVIDVRDEFQREQKILEEVTLSFPLGKVNAFAKKQSRMGKTILIYDAVGKQVRWLQYYLEKAKIMNYYFMEKGVKGYLDAGL